MVRNATTTETSSVTLGSFVEGVRDGKWKTPVKGVRDSGEFAKAAMKAARTPSAELNHGRNIGVSLGGRAGTLAD